jgi:NADH:ubiquinone oxidoreductase subunit 6 (subunit J)
MKGKVDIYALLLIWLESLFISTMFISYHADAAEAIQIIVLTVEELFA